MDKFTGRPAKDESRSDVETNTCDFLEKLNIPYETLCHEAIYTMAEIEDVGKVLGVSYCKNLFLCNKQHTVCLLMLPAEKQFKAKCLSTEMNCNRLAAQIHGQECNGAYTEQIDRNGKRQSALPSQENCQRNSLRAWL